MVAPGSAGLQDRLRAARTRGERLLDLVESGGVEPVVVRDRLAGLTAEVAEIEAKIAEAEGQEVDTEDVRALLAGLGDLAREVFTEAELNALRTFHQGVGLRVTYDPDRRLAIATGNLHRGVAPVSEGGLEPPRPVKGTSTSS